MKALKQLTIAMSVVGFGIALSACAGREKIVTLSSDLCKSVPAAQYAYKGKARQDQLYIDKSIEFGVRGCGHPRPAPRPAMWDAPKSSVLPTIIVPAKPALSPKKRRWWQRKTA